VTQENKELFEMWRQRMQKTASLERSARDELARVMNQRILVLLQVFAGHTAAGLKAVEDIQTRLAAADGTVRHKCMVDGEDSQSEAEEDDQFDDAVPVVRAQQPHRRRPSNNIAPPRPPRARPAGGRLTPTMLPKSRFVASVA